MPAYAHYYLQCPEGHPIFLPNPNQQETIGNPPLSAKEIRRPVFVCPECGLVSAYSGQDVRQELIADRPDLFQLRHCVLVSSDIECDGNICKAPKTIHTIQGSGTGFWNAKAIAKDWKFSKSARCGANHELHFDESRGLHWATPAKWPF